MKKATGREKNLSLGGKRIDHAEDRTQDLFGVNEM